MSDRRNLVSQHIIVYADNVDALWRGDSRHTVVRFGHCAEDVVVVEGVVLRHWVVGVRCPCPKYIIIIGVAIVFGNDGQGLESVYCALVGGYGREDGVVCYLCDCSRRTHYAVNVE